jgi:hypothetical protein
MRPPAYWPITNGVACAAPGEARLRRVSESLWHLLCTYFGNKVMQTSILNRMKQ